MPQIGATFAVDLSFARAVGCAVPVDIGFVNIFVRIVEQDAFSVGSEWACFVDGPVLLSNVA